MELYSLLIATRHRYVIIMWENEICLSFLRTGYTIDGDKKEYRSIYGVLQLCYIKKIKYKKNSINISCARWMR